MADPWSTIGYLLSYWKSPQTVLFFCLNVDFCALNTVFNLRLTYVNYCAMIMLQM